MSKFFQVRVQVLADVFVEVDDHESVDDAVQYACDEYSNVDGEVQALSIGELVSDIDIDRAKRHADKKLII